MSQDEDIIFKHKVLKVINSEENLRATTQAIELSNRERDKTVASLKQAVVKLKHSMDMKDKDHDSKLENMDTLIKNNFTNTKESIATEITTLEKLIGEKEKTIKAVVGVVGFIIMAVIGLVAYFK